MKINFGKKGDMPEWVITLIIIIAVIAVVGFAIYNIVGQFV